MSYKLESKLVVGIASSALFDLKESDRIFREQGVDAYKKHQLENTDRHLSPGVAFPFIKRLLGLNELNPTDPPVEVVLLSRNDPNAGLRVMKSIEKHGLQITRAIFLEGRPPYEYIPSLNISLFLSANEEDVSQAIKAGFPAGRALDSKLSDDTKDKELRIAFDFDGVIIDDEAETIYQETGELEKFHSHEKERVAIPHNPGPLKDFLQKLADIQHIEQKRSEQDNSYQPKLRVAIVTARSAPSHERVINTMRSWKIEVNEAFFLGGIEKRKVLEVLKPHIFFDDQKLHLASTSEILPSVHIPFGVTNQ